MPILTMAAVMAKKAAGGGGVPAIFGYDVKGGTEHSQASDNIYGTKFTLAGAGKAVSIATYIKYAAAGNCKFAIYDNALDFVIGSDEGSLSLGLDGWFTLDLTAETNLAAGDYWLCRWTSVSWFTYYDAGSAGQDFYKGLAYGAWPASISGHTTRARKYSIYCNYLA